MASSFLRRLLHLETQGGSTLQSLDTPRGVADRAKALEDGSSPLPVSRSAIAPADRSWHVPTPEEQEEGRRRAEEAFAAYQQQLERERQARSGPSNGRVLLAVLRLITRGILLLPALWFVLRSVVCRLMVRGIP